MIHIWSLFESSMLTYEYNTSFFFFSHLGDDPANISSSSTEDENSDEENNYPGIVCHFRINNILFPFF